MPAIQPPAGHMPPMLAPPGPATMAPPGLPPISIPISSGPAISGGGTNGVAGVNIGDFVVGGEGGRNVAGTSWLQIAAIGAFGLIALRMLRQ